MVIDNDKNARLELQHLLGDTYLINMLGLGVTAYKTSKDTLVLLDCGMGRHDWDALSAMLDREKLRVSAVIATHTHMDHVGCAAKLKEKYGAKVFVPYAEASICDSEYMIQSNCPFMPYSYVMDMFRTAKTSYDMAFRPEQESITVDGRKFGLLYTPGHSGGHTCVITPDGVMHMGDAVMGDVGLKNGRLPYAMNIKADFLSKKKIAATKCKLYVATHRAEVYDDVEGLIERNVAYMEQVVRDVVSLAAEPVSISGMIEKLMVKYSMHGNDPLSCCLIERNLRVYVDHAVETEKLKMLTENGIVKFLQA